MVGGGGAASPIRLAVLFCPFLSPRLPQSTQSNNVVQISAFDLSLLSQMSCPSCEASRFWACHSFRLDMWHRGPSCGRASHITVSYFPMVPGPVLLVPITNLLLKLHCNLLRRMVVPNTGSWRCANVLHILCLQIEQICAVHGWPGTS